MGIVGSLHTMNVDISRPSATALCLSDGAAFTTLRVSMGASVEDGRVY